jgi:hypothetical protein
MSERPARSRAFTREVWLDRLARFPLAGLTPAQFCAVEAVSLPSPGGTPELVLATGVVPRLPTGCDLDWVRSLAAALGDAAC